MIRQIINYVTLHWTISEFLVCALIRMRMMALEFWGGNLVPNYCPGVNIVPVLLHLPVCRAHVLHHRPERQLVVALDVGADVGTELACPLVLNINIILVRYFQNYDVYNYNLNL